MVRRMKKLSPKEVYKRLKVSEATRKKVIKAQEGIVKAYQKLDLIQKACPHYDSEYRNRGSTGSWDRDDSYWREYICNDCGLQWTTDQSYEMYAKYPYAIDKTRD